MEYAVSRIEVGIALILGLFHSYLVHYVYDFVPTPYMDEEFHINQTRRYCDGDYLTWNPKITTPPALYLLSVPIFCDAERYFNSAILPICFIGLCILRRSLALEKHVTHASILTALNVLILPVLWDTSILYYTDLLSLTAVVWGFNFENNPLTAASCFAIGVLTRQTNIVWAAMFCAIMWLQCVDMRQFVKSTARAVLRVWPFIGLAATFLTFLLVNGGIVLGDKSAHTVVFHAAQFPYFLGFVAFSTAPLFCKFLFFGGLSKSPYRSLSLCLFLVIVFSAAIHYSTLSHPYLLADNRHFPFYLWRKFLGRHWFNRYLPIPIYIVAFILLLSSTHFKSLYPSILFVLCTCACVVPAHLIEFRYFIIPYALWRLSVKESSLRVLYLEFIWSMLINCVALFLFFWKPFVWAHDPTSTIQRFMW